MYGSGYACMGASVHGNTFRSLSTRSRVQDLAVLQLQEAGNRFCMQTASDGVQSCSDARVSATGIDDFRKHKANAALHLHLPCPVLFSALCLLCTAPVPALRFSALPTV